MDNRKKREEVKMESLLERLLGKKISRRGFVKLCGMGIGTLIFNSVLFKLAFSQEDVSTGRKAKKTKGLHDLVVAKGEDPYAMAVKAIEAMGGMGKFVKRNSIVIIKPNISWDRTPEQAANTNPYVVAALIDLCFKAGARRVNVFDRSCNDAKLCYENSGIEKIAKEKGANVFFVDDWNTVKARFNYKSPMEGWPIYRDAVECDTFINVPILKHHGLTGLTLSMKNLMGVCAGNRGLIHDGIGLKLAHLADFLKPDLTVIDAYRVLTRGGPTGGRLEDIVNMKTLIVGTDSVLCDSYACRLMDKDPMSVSYISEGAKLKIGSADISMADILSINV